MMGDLKCFLVALWHKSYSGGFLTRPLFRISLLLKIFLWPDAVACLSTCYPTASGFFLCLASLFSISKIFLHYVHTLYRCRGCICKTSTRHVFVFHCCVISHHSHFSRYTAIRCTILWGKSATYDNCVRSRLMPRSKHALRMLQMGSRPAQQEFIAYAQTLIISTL